MALVAGSDGNATLIAEASDGNGKRPGRSGVSGVTAAWLEGERIVLEGERQRLTGYSRAWWYRLELQGKVPRRIRLGARKVGWKLSELMAWLEERAALRDAVSAAGGNDA